MRKLTCVLLAIILIFSCTTTAFAAESDTDSKIDVYAKYERNVSGEYTAKIKNGSAAVTDNGGATITISKAPSNATLLVVIPMTDETAKKWLADCLKNESVNILSAYDIHFEDAQGNRINANGETVAITTPKYKKELIVSSVATKSVCTKLHAQISKDNVTFTTNGNHYYVISDKKETITVPVKGDKNTVDADVTVDGNTVKMEELAHDKIDYVVGDRTQESVVKIDLTGLNEHIFKIVLPVNTIQYVMQVPDKPGNNTENLQINFNIGSVKLDDKAMKTVVEQAEGDEIILALESVGTDRLTDEQKETIEDMNVYGGFEAYLQCTTSKKLISNLEQGITTFRIPFTVPAGLKQSEFSVLHVSDNGEPEKLTTWFEDGEMCWDVNSLSNFIVVYDGDVETHNITVKDAVGGRVELDTTTPQTGKTVTIITTPNDGKMVDKVVVTDVNGKAVTVTKNGDGTYSFVQPNGDVTLEVTFKDKNSEQKLTISETVGGTVEISDDTPTTNQVVTIITKPDNGKVVDNVIVIDINGNEVKVTDNGDGTYTYVQPDGDVTVNVTFRDKLFLDNPYTGETLHLHIFICILVICGLLIVFFGKRKQNKIC